MPIPFPSPGRRRLSILFYLSVALPGCQSQLLHPPPNPLLRERRYSVSGAMLTLHENGGASLRLSSGDSILLEDQLLQYMMREAFKQAGPSQPATSQIQAANMLRLTFAMANIPNAVADHINKSAGGADAGVVLANILLREKTIVATLLDPDTGGTASMPIPESILENLRKAVAAKRSIGSP